MSVLTGMTLYTPVLKCRVDSSGVHTYETVNLAQMRSYSSYMNDLNLSVGWTTWG